MIAQEQQQKKMLRIKAERLRRGWRLEDLSHFSRVSAAEISRIENRRFIPYQTYLDRLAAALDIPAERLLDEVEP